MFSAYFANVTYHSSRFGNISIDSVCYLISQFLLSSSAVAPFVYMESTKCFGVFSDNGFLLQPDMPQDITFSTYEQVDLTTFQGGLTLRYIPDHISGRSHFKVHT